MAGAGDSLAAPLEGSAEQRARLGWAALANAPLAPDADEVIADGGWAGFTRAKARQWCWNLFQYEPRGFGLPVSQLSFPEVREWLNGGIPDARGYSERARELEAQGITPYAYRSDKEASGKPTFTAADVRFSASPSPGGA
jgi:hypothetical protein